MNRRSLAHSYGMTVKTGISNGFQSAVLFIGLWLAQVGLAQQPCVGGMRIDGVITDPTGAVIPGARVRAAERAAVITDGAGHYLFPCVPGTSTTITADAEGFARSTVTARARRGSVVHINLRIALAPVVTDIAVHANTGGVDSAGAASMAVLGTEDVQRLSDDPDDLLRQLQALAASVGGPPENAIVAVNGFQNRSVLPPRNAIASIRINPDLFSSEFETAPWRGGRIEVATKPGARTWHGAMFFVDSNGAFNATDPYSVTATPAGKQRYGFELSGPITRKTSDFFLALERRDIREFNVVNAVALDANDNPSPFQQTVAAPQQLWVGSARADWQITPNHAATLSFSANANNLGNQGIGGLDLAEAGFNRRVSEYDLHFLNTQILSAHLLHETRVGYSWKGTEQTPISTQPSLLVPGYFAGGGATAGTLNNRERDLEADDDLVLTRGKHTVKLGLQSFGFFVHDYDPDTFNGAYVFGGGSAPVLDADNNPTSDTTTISAIEQYRRALWNLPGGTPTTYQIVAGTPLVPLMQWRVDLYAQDSTKLSSRMNINVGLRYQLQTSPDSFANFAPRAGLVWAPNNKSNWVIHLNAGLFISPVAPTYAIEASRLDGVRQQETNVYSPDFHNPLAPAPGSITVNTLRQLPKTFAQFPSLMAQAGLEHDFPYHWHAAVDFDYGADWDHVREVNVNAPMVANRDGVAPDPTASLLAPRPIVPNENIFRYEEASHQRGTVTVIALRQNSYKRFGLSANYLHMRMRSDGGFRNGDTGAATPQSAYSQQGEFSRVDWETPNLFFLMGNVKLPFTFELSPLLNARSGSPFNITTGTDANGDGEFNDRPSYASATGPGVYSTRFGLLSANTVNGNVPRNLGTMPGLVHLDMNLRRTFTLNPADKDHPRTFTFNVQSTNLLNHTNITGVNTILSANAIGKPVVAEAARRIELGLRFSF